MVYGPRALLRRMNNPEIRRPISSDFRSCFYSQCFKNGDAHPPDDDRALTHSQIDISVDLAQVGSRPAIRLYPSKYGNPSVVAGSNIHRAMHPPSPKRTTNISNQIN